MKNTPPLKVFVDANVISKWLLLHDHMSKKTTLKAKEDLTNSYKKSDNHYIKEMFSAFDFIERFVLIKDKRFKFYYSPLVLTEVFNVLFERHIYEYMEESVIPLEELHRLRSKRFPVDTFKIIYSRFEKNIELVIKKMNIIKNKKLILKNFIGLSGVFVSEFGILSQDAHLLSEAVYADCYLFVTTDGELNEKFSKENDEIKFKFLCVCPARFISEHNSIKTIKKVKSAPKV